MAVCKVGDRIRLDYMGNDPCPIPAGETGTVDWVNDSTMYPQIGVRWDNGRRLMLIPGEDEFTVI